MSATTSRREGVLLYLLASNITLVLSTVTSLCLRNLIPIEYFGAFFLVNTYAVYLANVNVPVANLFDVQIPLLLGKSEEGSRVEEVVQESYTIQFWASFVQVAALLLIAYSLADSDLLVMTFAVFAATFYFAEARRLDYLLLKAHQQFRALFIAQLCAAIVGAAAMIIGAVAWGGSGYIVGYGIGILVDFCAARVLVVRIIRPKWRIFAGVRSAGRMVLSFGLVMALYRILEQAMMTLDRLFVEHFDGLKMLGIYSLAISLSGLVRNVPRSLAGGLRPSYLTRFAQGSHEVRIRETLRYHEMVMSLSMVSCLGAMLAVEFVVPAVFIGYEQAVLPAQLLFLGVMVQLARSAPQAFNLGANRPVTLLQAIVPGLMTGAALGWILVRDYSLTGAAISTSVAFAVSFTLLCRALPAELRWVMWRRAAFSVSVAGFALILRQFVGTEAFCVYTLIAGTAALMSLWRHAEADVLWQRMRVRFLGQA